MDLDVFLIVNKNDFEWVMLMVLWNMIWLKYGLWLVLVIIKF